LYMMNGALAERLVPEVHHAETAFVAAAGR
jgi:hypothetical protein